MTWLSLPPHLLLHQLGLLTLFLHQEDLILPAPELKGSVITLPGKDLHQAVSQEFLDYWTKQIPSIIVSNLQNIGGNSEETFSCFLPLVHNFTYRVNNLP